jgi:hypothetical protein
MAFAHGPRRTTMKKKVIARRVEVPYWEGTQPGEDINQLEVMCLADKAKDELASGACALLEIYRDHDHGLNFPLMKKILVAMESLEEVMKPEA